MIVTSVKGKILIFAAKRYFYSSNLYFVHLTQFSSSEFIIKSARKTLHFASLVTIRIKRQMTREDSVNGHVTKSKARNADTLVFTN